MSEERELLRDICAHPEDDTPRLVYADWLDEHSSGTRGDPNYDRACFIRAQVALASGQPLTAAQRTEMERVEAELLPAQETLWRDRLRDLDVRAVDFRRGFPETARMSVPDF